MESRKDRACEIQEQIRSILLNDWDPIGVADVPEAQDEYDSYIVGVYRLLISGVSERDVAEHLLRIESDWMGLGGASVTGLLPVAHKLLSLDVRLDCEITDP